MEQGKEQDLYIYSVLCGKQTSKLLADLFNLSELRIMDELASNGGVTQKFTDMWGVTSEQLLSAIREAIAVKEKQESERVNKQPGRLGLWKSIKLRLCHLLPLKK